MFRWKSYSTGDIQHYTIWVSKKYTVSIHKIIYREWLADEYPHDHGVDFLSIVLWGGYTEELFKDKYASFKNGEVVKRRWGSWHVMKNSASHKIIKVHPTKSCWTLFTTWNYTGERAFVYTPDGKIRVSEYYANLIKNEKIQKGFDVSTKPSSLKDKSLED